MKRVPGGKKSEHKLAFIKIQKSDRKEEEKNWKLIPKKKEVEWSVWRKKKLPKRKSIVRF